MLAATLGAQRVAMRIASGVTYLHGDRLGSTSVTSGASSSTQTYYPYGAVRSGSLPTDYTFTGQKLDASSGLMYYGARYYDAAIGRFAQPDSLIPNLYNPQSLNRYSYTLNNPVRYTDPTGHSACEDLECKDPEPSSPGPDFYETGGAAPAGAGGGSLEDTESRFDAERYRTTSGLNYALDNLLFAIFPPAKRAQMFAWSAYGIFFGPDRGQSATDLSYVIEANLQNAALFGTTAPVAVGPPIGPGIIYRSGGRNPGNLVLEPGEEALSFRDSISNPWPLPPGQQPVFKPGKEYIAVDIAKLPEGSVVYDYNPPGHVGVINVPPNILQDAIIFKGRFPK